MTDRPLSEEMIANPHQGLDYWLKRITDLEAENAALNVENTRALARIERLRRVVWAVSERKKGQCLVCGTHERLHDNDCALALLEPGDA